MPNRTRFEIIRSCERDMRCCARDMRKRRRAIDTIQRLSLRKRKGYKVNDIELARAKLLRDKLTPEILSRFGVLRVFLEKDAELDRLRAESA